MGQHKILIVEDESMIAEDLSDSLNDMGYLVVGSAASGQEALNLVKAHQPDLVLMDIMLKGAWDGIVTAEAIQSQHACAIIYLTAYTDREMMQRAKITSPFGYILKPFREKELHAMVEISLYRHAQEQENLARQQLFLQTLLRTPDAVIATDAQGLCQFLNPAAERLVGQFSTEVQDVLITQVLNDCAQSVLDWESFLNAPPEQLVLTNAEGEKEAVQVTVSPIRIHTKQTNGFVFHLLKQKSPHLAKSAQEMFSICASCKNVRNHQGLYVAIEQFLREHFDMKFSHGICPGCFQSLYPEYFQDSPGHQCED